MMPRTTLRDGGTDTQRWLLTYADLITLLAIFLLVLYSMSALSGSKFNAVALSMRSGFGSGRAPASAAAPGTPAAAQKPLQQLSSYVEQHNLEGQVALASEPGRLVLTIHTGGLLFNRSSAQLGPSAAPLLARAAAVLRGMQGHVVVEGHTCDLPVHSPLYPTNWELSTARATRVVRALIALGISPLRLGASGFADTRPVAPNDTEAHRALNRRVEIVVMLPNSAPTLR